MSHSNAEDSAIKRSSTKKIINNMAENRIMLFTPVIDPCSVYLNLGITNLIEQFELLNRTSLLINNYFRIAG